ncbi:hypothetical protein J5751_01770 [bacterium]|nr:hypothetical protein [bacterium]
MTHAVFGNITQYLAPAITAIQYCCKGISFIFETSVNSSSFITTSTAIYAIFL